MTLPATSTVCQCSFLVFVHLVSLTYTSESTLRIRSSFECLFMTCIPGFVVNVTKRAGLPRYVGFSRTSKELESSQWKHWRFTWRTLPSIKQTQIESPKLSRMQAANVGKRPSHFSICQHLFLVLVNLLSSTYTSESSEFREVACWILTVANEIGSEAFCRYAHIRTTRESVWFVFEPVQDAYSFDFFCTHLPSRHMHVGNCKMYSNISGKGWNSFCHSESPKS